jgi:hypothetical protein
VSISADNQFGIEVSAAAMEAAHFAKQRRVINWSQAVEKTRQGTFIDCSRIR